MQSLENIYFYFTKHASYIFGFNNSINSVAKNIGSE